MFRGAPCKRLISSFISLINLSVGLSLTTALVLIDFARSANLRVDNVSS